MSCPFYRPSVSRDDDAVRSNEATATVRLPPIVFSNLSISKRPEQRSNAVSRGRVLGASERARRAASVLFRF
jgi:hypothetical protein